MRFIRWIGLTALCATVLVLPACAQRQNARDLVQKVVQHELKAEAADHSSWMYLDKKKTGDGSTLTLVVETPQGNLSRTLKIDGKLLTPEQRAKDKQRMHKFVTDPSVRRQQKQDEQEDSKKAVSLTKMLPDAFHWRVIGRNGDLTTLSFWPNRKFNPPTREAEVFAAMEGTMTVNTKENRIWSLQGKLMDDVTFGWFGIFGRLYKGGTFRIERRPIGHGKWAITQTHVHIHGNALIFHTISEDEDEIKSHFKPAPPDISLAEAERMLNSGKVAKELGIPQVP